MMIDTKGLLLIIAGLMCSGAIVGQVLVWLAGAPWYVPIIGAFLPVFTALMLVVVSIACWMRDEDEFWRP